MTKNVDAGEINQYITYMSLRFADGRAGVAAQLHYVADRLDSWDCRGAEGRWVRRHGEWRSSLFTPFGVPKGPGKMRC